MSQKQSDGTSKHGERIVAKAWTDETFKKRLLADPAAVLKEHGMEMPPGIQVRIVENTEEVRYLTLPRPGRPSSGELAEEELARVAGGLCEHDGLEKGKYLGS